MDKIVIFGNSGSGKSTLAKSLSSERRLSHLDLDVLAWLDTLPPQRRSLSDSLQDINNFTQQHPAWVVEGCYADLLSVVIEHASEIIFLNPGIDTCIANCRNRPWEPHKYPSQQAQDANLEMLIDWVRDYASRDDEFSLPAHRRLFDEFAGKKRELTSNRR